MEITTGIRPSFDYQTVDVSGSFVFEKNEWGRMEGQQFRAEIEYFEHDLSVVEHKFLYGFIEEMRNKGGEVKYLRFHSDVVNTGFGYIITFTIDECFFVGDPFIVDDVIAIGVILLIGFVSFLLLGGIGIIQHLVGITPEDAAKYNLATAIPILLIGGLVLIYFIYGRTR